MTQHYHGYSGSNYDKWIERNSNTSALGKVQKQFWFTKSAVLRKLGKREDEYIVASDAELDSKIDLFKAIESSTKELQILLADYQNKICILAQEENALGRLLKEYGKQDQTRAGKMMLAVGKSLSYTAQQRVALRNPLVRLFQEVDTFQSRAVEDTSRTVEEMEKIRTEYRGALMWMKNISQDFNPDHYQQLEKFREVQTLVKQKKSKFDQIKIKSLQKIELLSASRCNMFSHALILYQNNLITFSEKTAKTLNSVASNFRGYHPYKFHVIKELADPIGFEETETEEGEDTNKTDMEMDEKTFFDSEYHDDELEKCAKESSAPCSNRANKYKKKEEKMGKNSESLVNLFQNESSDHLLSIEDQVSPEVSSKTEVNSMAESLANVDLMSESNPSENISSNAEILKELFESPVHDKDVNQLLPSFGAEIFGKQNNSSSLPLYGGFSQNPSSQIFLPSQLLDFGMNDVGSKGFSKPNHRQDTQLLDHLSFVENYTKLQEKTSDKSITQEVESTSSNSDSKGMHGNSSLNKQTGDTTKVDWYKVFQDIDPLADPGNAIFSKGFGDKKC